MKKTAQLLLLSMLPLITVAQDIFKANLYEAETIIEYKEEINLEEKQEMQIKDIYLKGNTEFMEKKWELKTLNKEMNKMLSESTIDKAATELQLRKILDLESEIKLLKFSTLVDIKNTLSSKQQEQLDPYVDSSKGSFTSEIFMGKNYEVQVKVNEKSNGQPLYILESKGEQFELKSVDINEINPTEIQSISVLKGEQATESYGEQGKDGVVIISVTKSIFNEIKTQVQN